jgi:hypothetical protein
MKFKVGETEYEVPDHISLESYSKIYKVKDLYTDEYFAAKLINMITGAPLEDLYNCDYMELSYISAYIMSLIPLEVPKFQDKFEIDGVKYGFFPNWRDLTYAEFVDMDTISTKKEDELLGMLHILAAIMYRPIIEQKSEHDFKIEKYDLKTMIPRSELFKKKLDCKYLLGAQFFFINYARRYSHYTQLSSIQSISIWTRINLIWKMRKLIWKMIFKGRLVGSLSQTELLEMILQSTTTSTRKM